jgi:hypothetical protein
VKWKREEEEGEKEEGCQMSGGAVETAFWQWWKEQPPAVGQVSTTGYQ